MIPDVSRTARCKYLSDLLENQIGAALGFAFVTREPIHIVVITDKFDVRMHEVEVDNR